MQYLRHGGGALPRFVGCCRLVRVGHRFYSSPCYYNVLGVPKDASRSQIKAAFVELSKKYHPDKNLGAGAEAASVEFCKINEAYSVLVDPGKRNLYDRGLYGQNASTRYHQGVPRDEKFDFYKYNPYSRSYSYYDGYGAWKTVRTDTDTPEFKKKNVRVMQWLVVIMALSAVVQSIRAVQSHKLYNQRSLEKTRRYQVIYDELRETTVEEQLEKLAEVTNGKE